MKAWKSLVVVCAFVVAVAAAPLGASRLHGDEEISIKSGPFTLAGTLSVPSGSGPFPAVVLLSGSGPQNRDSEAGGFRPFKVIADDFVKRGIAVLRFDDRGVGGSTGNLADTTTEELADDALAAVQVLRGHQAIDQKRIGLVGHSEGALVAAVAAARDSNVAYLVWLAGSAVSGAEILRQQAEEIPRRAGASAAAIAEILRCHDALIAAVRENAPAETLMALSRTLSAAQHAATKGGSVAAPQITGAQAEALLAQSVKMLQSKWMRFFVTFDQASTLRHVSVPVFAAFGGRDALVPEALNRPRVEAALKGSGNQNVTVRVYPEANHLFMPSVTGQIAEYFTLPKVFVPTLLEDMATWIARR